MEASLKCGSCTHMKSYIDHPKYGQIEIHYGKNAELIEKLIIELWEQDHTIPYATCELGYLEEARRRVVHGYECDRHDSRDRARRCPYCGEALPKTVATPNQ